MAAPTACATLAEKVSKMHEALRLKEDGARRQADADGVLVAPLQDVCTASRLASAAQVLEEDAPARAAAKSCTRAGVGARGAAKRGAPGAAGVQPGATPPAKRAARRTGDGAVLEAVDDDWGVARGSSGDASDIELRAIMMGTPAGRKQRWARPGR